MEVKGILSTHASLSMHSANAADRATVQRVQPPAQQKPDYDTINHAIEDFNKKMAMMGSHIRIEFDKETNMKVVKVIDDATKEVIRQIPSEQMLRIAKYIDELTGLLFSKEV